MSNPRNIVKGIFTFFLCFVMSACTGIATTQPSAFPSPVTPQIPEKLSVETTTPTFISATVRPSFTPTPNIQPTRNPTYTLNPPHTATLRQPTETETLDPQSMLTDQAFKQKATQIASFPVICEKFYVEETSLSPNGNWLAIPCGNSQDQTLEIENKTGKHWILHFKDYLPEEFAREGMQKGNLYPAQFTIDEAYLYFKSYIYVDAGGGTCFYGFGYQGLYRINVNTGEVTAVLPPIIALDGYDIAFSPDWSKLAYNGNYPMILDLRTGENISVDDTGGVVGDITWSPDGSYLAFATCYPSGGDINTVKNSALKIYSLETHKSRTILVLENSKIRIEFVNGNNQLRIAIDDYTTNQTNYSFFNWSSGQLITPSVTPTP